jgi:uncharacterized protein (DUF4415 family)
MRRGVRGRNLRCSSHAQNQLTSITGCNYKPVVIVKRRISKRLTAAQRAELEALAALPGDRIDVKDIPEVRGWTGAQRGLLFRPIKKQLTLRIDADIISWFRSAAVKGEGYQTRINRALREYLNRHARQSQEDWRTAGRDCRFSQDRSANHLAPTGERPAGRREAQVRDLSAWRPSSAPGIKILWLGAEK